MKADGGLDKAWQLASASARHRIDLIDGIGLVDDEALKRALYPLVSSTLSTPSAPAPVAVNGRYVRVLLPGRERTLGLAEVEVLSGGVNIAPKGAATQSSGIPGGDFGGSAAEALDGNTDVSQAGKAASFTTRELDPWWELDLGAERAIDTLVVRPYLAEGEASRGSLYVAVLNGSREIVATADGLSTGDPVHTVRLGGDLTPALREVAIAALPSIPGHDEQTVTLLTGLAREGSDQATAIDALSRIPRDRWPASQLAPAAEALLAYARHLPVADRTGAEFKQVVSLGREVIARLPQADGTRLSAALDALSVRTIRIEAVLAQMKFDVTQFSVAPGEDVEIVFVNKDHMPHNLLVTAPGKLEDGEPEGRSDGQPARWVPEALRAGDARRAARHDADQPRRDRAPALHRADR